jgi:hypothetical protein
VRGQSSRRTDNLFSAGPDAPPAVGGAGAQASRWANEVLGAAIRSATKGGRESDGAHKVGDGAGA